MKNQNHTSVGSDSRNSGNKKLIFDMLGRAILFPLMFILSFSFLPAGAFMQSFRRTNYWTTALLLTAVAIAGDLIVENSPEGRFWEQR